MTTVDFHGHASVYGRGYEMYGGPDKGGWIEFVDRGAARVTLAAKPDVAFLLNHDGVTLARTTAGTMRLYEDNIGLAVEAQLDRRVSHVNDLEILIETGALSEMSFAFRVTGQKWLTADGEEVPWWDLSGIERHITAIDLNHGDVSVVNFGANPYTDAAIGSTLRSVPTINDAERARRAFTACVVERDKRAWQARHPELALVRGGK